MDILTKSKLVVKRIASGETKQPRIPVTAELLASEVRLGSPPRASGLNPGPGSGPSRLASAAAVVRRR